MRLSRLILITGLFVVAAIGALSAAWYAAGIIERMSKAGIERQLMLQGLDWAEVQTDGLQVFMAGTAPDESARFKVLAAAAAVVDSTRVIDNMAVREAEAITPPRFSIEILRNDSGISLIGLIPASTDRAALAGRISAIAAEIGVTDLLEIADYPPAEGWERALDYSVTALAMLPRSKISVSADRIAITAISDGREQKRSWEAALSRELPAGLALSLSISAPRPVITPFTLRFLIDDNGARFDACSAHTPVGRKMILAAAAEAGLLGEADCTIGLGVPSPDWPQAVARAIRAVAELGGGSVTFSDADVTLVAPETTATELFDTVVGELEADLPDLYSLHAVLPEPVSIVGTGEAGPQGEPEFVATRSPEGQVQLRGRLTDERQRLATESFARARFGVGAVYNATLLDSNLPEGWPVRVLAALESLSFLDNGVVVVQPGVVSVRGKTGIAEANAEIARILSEKLGEAQNFQVDVAYFETASPEPDLPTPEECVAGVNAVLEETKITFAPGSDKIDSAAREVIDRIADILRDCPEAPIEIAGYTDSQGRETMNLALSQSRAQAVLNALLARRVLTSSIDAKGYGEADPIADNGTEEGREANRRIEFRLIAEVPVVAQDGDGPQDGGGENVDNPVQGDATPPPQNPDQEETE
jgi:OOP family OmpA-OmpF porin